MSLVTRADRGTVLGKLLQTRMRAKPGSEELKAANEQIEKLDNLKKKRTPGYRHKQRVIALYVDPVSPDRWNRPINEISQTTAYDYLQDAANDYSGQYDRYTNPHVYKPDDPELCTALEEWTGRPTLACPERPLLPCPDLA